MDYPGHAINHHHHNYKNREVESDSDSPRLLQHGLWAELQRNAVPQVTEHPRAHEIKRTVEQFETPLPQDCGLPEVIQTDRTGASSSKKGKKKKKRKAAKEVNLGESLQQKNFFQPTEPVIQEVHSNSGSFEHVKLKEPQSQSSDDESRVIRMEENKRALMARVQKIRAKSQGKGLPQIDLAKMKLNLPVPRKDNYNADEWQL